MSYPHLLAPIEVFGEVLMSKDKSRDWHQVKKDAELKEEQFLDDEMDEEDGGGAQGSRGALEHPSYLALEEKLTLAEQQAHENWEKAVRAMAELENVRRRAERDVANAHRFGQEKLIHSFLPVIDSLEQALQLADNETQVTMREGLVLTLKLFIDALKKIDVEQIDPLGAVFNPQEHEAMTMQEATAAAPNTILTVLQKGYKLHDRVIRPARVIIAKPTSSNKNA